MKLNELHGYKQYLDKSLRQVFQDLGRRHGWLSANGSYAVVVYSRSKPYVYRIWRNDAGYDTWLEYALKHQDNPAIVKVLGKVKSFPFSIVVPDKGPEYKLKYVKIEKLKPLSAELRDLIRIVWAYGKNIERIANIAMATKDIKKHADSIHATSEYIANKAFIEVFLKVVIDLHALGVKVDMHEDNVMRRANGQMVITDAAYEPSPFNSLDAPELFAKLDTEMKRAE
jgi:hypothetical protein